MNFDFRGLELCGMRMWERGSILKSLDFIEKHGMTALVLHETDGLQKILYPRVYFDPYAKWKSAPARRGENAILNNRVYFEHILNLASHRRIDVWLEIKQLGFPDEVLEMRPDLIKDGNVCPSEPFWYEFLENSVDELYRDYPKLSGLIISAGSPEGRASRAQNKCQCELCKRTPLADWYENIILSMWKPSEKHGKRMAVRDFAYKPQDHEPLIAAMDRTPKDIAFCIKVTPHDFYPTFPHNSAIGRLRDRVQWLEYDTMGQFYGLAVVPGYVGSDLRDRMEYGEARGVTGGVFRVEWERVNDWWSIDTINETNLIAAAMLTRGDDVATARVCELWLQSQGWPTEAASWLASALDETWDILKRALYIDDFMFADSSFFPRGVEKAWWTMETKHSLIAWDPSRAGDLKLDPQRIKSLLEEKAEAVRRVNAYAQKVRQGDPSLPAELHELLIDQAGLFVTYVEGFEACARVCLWARAKQEGVSASDAALAEAIDLLQSYSERIRPITDDAKYPHQVAELIDVRRVEDVLREGRAIAAGSMAA
ncbi:hypothetical protein SAMN04515648_3414 [Phyllobacterium sp. CL33Tsu]|uniref:hypothetical protein n=1 Tax=Phyllobacterium sp. CL33Tsu TaxID=1798191 RepID=UPI0008EF50E8|nr:hypothetical protein [Phyllobacterium sp. CL33Tsu]SFJ28330.1 hypothetical protein SAMN04515648_3414 [Phyllobacterium sp. CL33Tsu]